MTNEVLRSPEALKDLTAYDRDGRRVGTVLQVYVDDWSGNPEWVTVRSEPSAGGEDTGAGAGETFVPLAGAGRDEGELHLACLADTVRTAPRMDAEQHLGLDQEQQLYVHYGIVPPDGEASGAPGVGDNRPKAPVTGDEKDLQDVKELADEPAAPAPRLRKFAATDPDSATAGSSGVHGENR